MFDNYVQSEGKTEVYCRSDGTQNFTILYSQRIFTGNQCSLFNSIVMLSRLGSFRTSRAATKRICSADRPAKTELQESRPELVIKAAASLAELKCFLKDTV